VASSRDPAPLLGLTVYLLSQTAGAGKRVLDGRLAERGLRLRHMAVLAALSEAGAAHQSALGRSVRLDPSDMTATVDDLERAGYVERRVDPGDRRRRVVRLTREGDRTLAELRAMAEGVADELLAPLPEARRRRLHEDLAVVLAALRGEDGELSGS
jgi:MarR family transcriptional regulator, lower aerobic nicotinate degradation pathway regulator